MRTQKTTKNSVKRGRDRGIASFAATRRIKTTERDVRGTWIPSESESLLPRNARRSAYATNESVQRACPPTEKHAPYGHDTDPNILRPTVGKMTYQEQHRRCGEQNLLWWMGARCQQQRENGNSE